MKYRGREGGSQVAVALRRWVRGLAFVLALALPLALAQTTSDSDPQIVVPVTVADRSGRAVVGLDQGSFKVAVDGRLREIAAFAASKTVDAYVVFAPDVAQRWRDIREKAVGVLKDSAPDDGVTVLLSREDSVREEEPVNTVRLPEPRRRYLTGGDELADMIDLGFDSMKRLPTRDGRRRVIFVVLSSPPEGFRRSRRRLLEKAARGDIQLFALWRSRHTYTEYEGRSMKLVEDLVEQTGGRSAQFTEPEEIPGILMQFSAALRRAYELRVEIPSDARDRKLHKIEVDVRLPSGDPHVRVSFRSRYSPVPD